MKIIDIIKSRDVTLSFEVFPPKTDAGLESVLAATGKIAALHPAFMSVTYGAGGSTSKRTAQIAADLQNQYGTTVLAHLTCVAADREKVAEMVKTYKEIGVENIMALRGDLPLDGVVSKDYKYAAEMIADIKKLAPDMCIGGACYPEGHVECARQSEDIEHLKAKVDQGVDFLTTQMFFDNNILYNFLYKIRGKGINVPVCAGIMPITNAKQVSRSVALSGSTIPHRFRTMVDRYGDDPDSMRQAGVIYATEQIVDLIANGVNNIHVYSMNKPEVAAGIQASISSILGLDK
ncbi:MAG: methylenetetrahydrofolate reductase [Oscillospiraceae bacterium]|nr:methylenetetrahydrofolate reductase [NAD(P)H] [Oscillospiraceae bacterium]